MLKGKSQLRKNQHGPVKEESELELVDESTMKANQEYRDIGNLNSDTLKLYFSSMSWFLFINFLFWTVVMVVSKSLIDFWLKGQAPGSNSHLHFLDRWFDYNF